MVKEFFKGATKIAVAIVVAVVVLSILGALAMFAYNKHKENEAKPLEEVKTWHVDTQKPLKMNLSVYTKLVGGQMLVRVNFDGHPSYLESPKNANGGFLILFNDKDGFKLFEKKIELSEFTGNTGADGKRIGLSYDFTQYLAMETYTRFASATVSWYLDLDAGVAETLKMPEMPPPMDKADYCAPGISREERLKRLAEYGAVRQTGETDFSVGRHTVSFYPSGGLLVCY